MSLCFFDINSVLETVAYKTLYALLVQLDLELRRNNAFLSVFQ